MKKLLFLSAFLFFLNASAQKDFRWLKLKKFKVADLENRIEETSSLNFFGDRLFTLNDSGHPAELFELDPKSGKILKIVSVPEAENFDWEALTNDGKYFYIGDIGNNWGTRSDLKIYKVSADSLKSIGEIKFSYPEQKELIKKPQNNNFDAESLVYVNNKLHLFTKEWVSYKITHYAIPSDASQQSVPAQKMEEFNLGFIATDVSYFENKLYIVGYTKKMEVYMSVFNEDDRGNFFSQNPKKFYLGMSSGLGQIEGIAVNSDGIYISGERFNLKPFNVSQRLYFIPATHFQKAAR